MSADPITTAREQLADYDEATRSHPLVMDGRIVRFKTNRMVAAMLEHCQATGLDLNNLWERLCNGEWSTAEHQEVYRQIGYSVTGYQEIFPDPLADMPSGPGVITRIDCGDDR